MKPEMHSNNIGFLRLLFASLVIVSHAPEIIDGNRSREILTSLIGTRTFAELSVDGFFLLSGYLIVQSYDRSSSILSYFRKRIFRIYPGFLAAVFVCFLLAQITGGNLHFDTLWSGLRFIVTTLGLQPSPFAGFTGLPYPSLNGALWTIGYEFRCYIFTAAFGVVGLIARRDLFAAMTALMLVLTMLPLPHEINGAVAFFTGYPSETVRFLAAFTFGACFYLYRGSIPLNGFISAAAMAALIICMLLKFFETTAFIVFGGYIIFWFSFCVRSKRIAKINGKEDISYGVYLYGWPISSSLLYFCGVTSPSIMIILSLPLTFLAGYISWTFVEKRFTRSAKPRAPEISNPTDVRAR